MNTRGHHGMLLAAASAWTPAQLNPRDWFNETSSVTDAGGGACSQWDNLRPSGNLTQATGTARPLIVSGAQNGLRAIRFDGTSDYLQWSAATGIFQNASAGWVFAVFKRLALDGGAGADRTLFWNCINTNGNTRFLAVVGRGSGAADRVALLAKRLDADSTATLNADTLADTNYHMALWRMEWSVGAGYVYFDGNAPTSNLSLTTSGSTSNTVSASAPTIGALISGGPAPVSFANMELGEFVLHNAALNDADIDRLFGYAAHKWGLTALLPGGHPYKTEAPTI